MANEVKDKFSISSPFTITLVNLLGSTNGVGRQSSFVDNTSNRWGKVLVYGRFQVSGTVSGSRGAYVYGLREDGNGHTTDGAASGDAGFTVQNSQLLGVALTKPSPSVGDYVYGEFIFDSPGPKFGVAITHDFATTLSNESSGQWIRYVGINPEIQ